jgi:hypothetical protein
MPHRISLATQITGNFKHLKRSIKDLLNSRGVGHILQTTQMNDSEKLTSLFMEGESIFLYTVREELVSHLRSIFPGICIQDWKEMASDAPLFGSQFGSISRDQTQRLESKWNDCFYSGFIQVVPALQHGRPVAIDIQSSIDRITEKLIHITYKNNTVYKSIGAFLPWTRWKQVIQECKELEIKQPISGIYSLLDTGEKSY